MDQYNIIATNNVRPEVVDYKPSQEEMDFVSKVYNDFTYDYSIKNQTWQVLNNRTLNGFWQQSNYDYNVIVNEEVNNPVVQYSSGITRDKANTFISNLTLQLLYPSVTAFNSNQDIDVTVSSIAKPVLKWQFINDGRPSESGKLKNVRYTHKQVVEGTLHILDVIGDNGRLTSYLIPNEEVFIPNFYQPNVQLQGHFIWAKQWASYAEVQAEFGHLEKFKYVTPGSLGWLAQTYEFKENYKALQYQDQCSVIRAWYPVREDELEKLKKAGKLPKFVKKAKYFNILINQVPMFEYDNLMPYYHGEYPVTKGVFEFFSPSDFYWGNSMPNKAYQDKHFLDGWKTLIRYKAKLAAIPPLLNFTGQHIEQDVVVPGVISDFPAGTDPKLIATLPGITNGVTNSDVAILKDTYQDIERETAAPQTSGQQAGGSQTARETMVIEQNAQKIMLGFAQQVSFVAEARAFPILKGSFQFLPRQDIKKLAIPNETFDDGSSGTLEVIFKKMPKMTEAELLQESYSVLKEEKKLAGQKQNVKKVYVDPEYINNADFYCEAIADELPANNTAYREAKAEYKWNLYKEIPGANIQRIAKKMMRELGDNPDELLTEVPAAPQASGGQMPQPGPVNLSPQNPMRKMAGQAMANI